jgi:hypothetical protein
MAKHLARDSSDQRIPNGTILTERESRHKTKDEDEPKRITRLGFGAGRDEPEPTGLPRY